MRELPLFPLNTVLFPGMPLELYIFEDRYQRMIRRCISSNQPFGVVLIRDGVEALGPLASPYPIGCSANIVEVEHLSEGRMNISAVGDERFRIHQLDRSHAYLVGHVEMLPLDHPYSLPLARGMKKLSPWLDAYLTLLSRIDRAAQIDPRTLELPDDPLLLLNLAATLLQVPNAEKQALLSAHTAADFLRGVERLYRREVSVLRRIGPVSEAQAERAAWMN